MKTSLKVALGISSWVAILLVIVPPMVTGCKSKVKEKNRVDRIIDEGLLLNDDLVAVKSEDGKVSIKNEVTGKVTIKDINIDWTQPSTRDSLAVFCSEKKRGYYNMYTGEISIPAQYRRAWIFSEGLAAVQKNGKIGFIDHKGNTVIDFKYPYHGNPLSCFVFEDGHCVVADTTGKCGVIDKKGNWLILPEYDNVSAFKEFAIVSKAGLRQQVDYAGNVLNGFVLDYVSAITYEVKERCENKDGDVRYIRHDVNTGLFSYRVGGRCGLMDANCRRLTEPLYSSIVAIDKNLFRATLPDHYSEVILNAKGVVMK